MDGWMEGRRARRMLVGVAFGLSILALSVTAGGQDAAAQSGVTLGSALDQPAPSESLLPSGSFRLDGPGENSLLSGAGGDPHAGATSLGLQIYGSDSGLAPRPADNDAPPAPPLDGTLSRP